MSNVLSEAKKQQVIALGRLGWPLRRIEQETGVRRETAGAYLKSGRDWSASAEGVGTATAGKTGQHGQPQPKPKHQHRKPFYEGKSKSRNRKTGQCEWGDHRVWRGVERLETERCEACSVHQFLRTVP